MHFVPIIKRVATAAVLVYDTTTETSLLAGGAIPIRANEWRAGSALRITAHGYINTSGTPNLDLALYAGATKRWSELSVPMASGMTSCLWHANLFVVCRSAGASGVAIARGVFHLTTAGYTGIIAASFIDGDDAGTFTLDTTAASTFDFKAKWGTANVNNSVNCDFSIAEFLQGPEA